MNILATINWGFVGLLVIAIGLLVASPFIVAFFRATRSIAYTSTDEFRLRNTNMWTEAHHTKDGGSHQMMRLNDGVFVFVSIGVTTAKVFVTPDITDASRYKEMKEFTLPNGLLRLDWSQEKRHAEDLKILERVRRTIAWPNSADELAHSLVAMDSNLPLDDEKSVGQ
jgi:hypothetical protein